MSERFLGGLSEEITEWLERTGLARVEDLHHTGHITITIPTDGNARVSIVRIATDEMMRDAPPDLSRVVLTFDKQEAELTV